MRVVLELCRGLNGRNVTCDNFFTSHALAVELKKEQMTQMVGTIRKNRKEIPPVLSNMKKKPVLHSEFVFDHRLRATMVSYVPKRNKFVILLSTLHTKKEIDSGNAHKPEIIKFYNSTKGAVDILDEMVGSYRCKRKVLRWPLALFQNMLDISAVNALVLFLDVKPQWKLAEKNYRRRLFLIELGKALCEDYMLSRTHMPRGERSRDVIYNAKGISREGTPSTSSGVSTTSSPVPWLSQLNHTPATKKRARCRLCHNKANSNAYTARCDRCNRAVCSTHRFIVCENCCGIRSNSI